ncbi:hypothetical protein LYSHEL_06830 [Lysobacter helvus]|uniref:histidine kinase n=2 Tax=Lysobacteraceae TaxID=32033 RepID=A0ABN6FQH3_9GAMM|nr:MULTISPECIES: ATP-binding protein [Lysobacter]BCT91659.1 hypothetical protein LYSCAS_06830 [Lysobacter caseinilyticus]BCT94812.1 hypothetical protein LYSHEL_06830 [Lysobacter helvus]
MNGPTTAFDPIALLEAVDWRSTPLGARSQWPATLKSLLALILRSHRPQYLVWGPDRRFFYNAAFLPVMGIKHPQGFGQPMSEVWPEVWHEIEPLVSSSIDEGASHFFEDRPFVLQRHGHDEQTYFSFSYTPVEDDEGRIAGLMCVLNERTDAIEAETRQRAQMRRMQELLQQAPGFACVTYGPTHVITIVNDAYERLVGQSRDALIGRPVAEALPEVIDQGYVTLLDHVFRYREPFVGRSLPVRLARPDATTEERILDFVYQPILDGNGSMDGIFIQGSDVTARVRAETELRRSEQALRDANANKDRFLAVLGHELRNPLAPIHTATELLRHLVRDPRATQCIDVIARQTRHMTALVEDLVDMARITNNLIALDRRPVDLNAIVEGAVEQLRPSAAARDHAVVTHLADRDVVVDGDGVRLTQVVTNLLSNAIRYTPVGGSIRITVSRDNARARIDIEDNGEGIAPELLPELFEPFVQAHRATDREHGGLGIGLTLVKRLVEAHGGEVEVASEGLGRGSRFTVRLPLAS